MKHLLRPVLLALAVVLAGMMISVSGSAWAAPKFPALTGRVVDSANILSPQIEQDLTQKLEGLETQTHRQLVVATVPSLDGQEIEDYGYQLGRAWGIGEKGKNTGVVFLVAPNDRKVRIEVGYGLEPVLTDALSSVILQTKVLPKFKAGDIPGGVVDGTDAIIAQLALPDEEAKQNVAEAAKPKPESSGRHNSGLGFIHFIVIAIILLAIFGGGRRRGGLGGALPWMILGALSNNRNDDDWGGGGGGWGGGGGGGGGFSGGGGSFGGGGSSGSW